MNRKLLGLFVGALSLGLALITPVPVSASPVTGTLSITGNALVSATGMVFQCDKVSPFSCPASTGQFQVTGSAAQSGSFTSLALTYGNIVSLNEVTDPLNQTFSLPNFLTFAADPNTVLDLTFIHLGSGGACPPSGSAGCTPKVSALVTVANPSGLSPFTFTNVGTGVSGTLYVSGVTRNTGTGETAAYNGVITATFTNTTVSQLLSEFAAGSSVQSSYSGEFVAAKVPVPTPEPSSLLLLGSSALGLFPVIRRKARG